MNPTIKSYLRSIGSKGGKAGKGKPGRLEHCRAISKLPRRRLCKVCGEMHYKGECNLPM